MAQIPSCAERTATGAERDRRVRIRFQNPGVRLRMNDLMTAIIVVREKPDALLIQKLHCVSSWDAPMCVLEGETRREIDVDVGIRGATHVEILDGLEEACSSLGNS